MNKKPISVLEEIRNTNFVENMSNTSCVSAGLIAAMIASINDNPYLIMVKMSPDYNCNDMTIKFAPDRPHDDNEVAIYDATSLAVIKKMNGVDGLIIDEIINKIKSNREVEFERTILKMMPKDRIGVEMVKMCL